MGILSVSRNYFTPFVSPSGKNEVTKLTVLKIASYFTLVIPFVFACLYGAASLFGRVSRLKTPSELDKGVQNEANKYLNNASSEKSPSETSTGASQPQKGGDAPSPNPSTPLNDKNPKNPQGAPVSHPASSPSVEPTLLIDEEAQIIRSYSIRNHVPYQRSGVSYNETTVDAQFDFGFKNETLGRISIVIRLSPMERVKADVIVATFDPSNDQNPYLSAKDDKLNRFFKPKEYQSGIAVMIEGGENNNQDKVASKIFVVEPQGKVTPGLKNLLYSTYYNALVLAEKQKKNSISIPFMGTKISSLLDSELRHIPMAAIYFFLKENNPTNLKNIHLHLSQEAAGHLGNWWIKFDESPD